MIEEWRAIKGYETIYEVSSLGRIRSLTRDVLSSMKNNSNKTINGKILKGSPDKDGYIKIGLFNNLKRKPFLVHRVVALTFLNNEDDKPYVRHINGIRSDNRVENVEWVDVLGKKRYIYKPKTVSSRTKNAILYYEGNIFPSYKYGDFVVIKYISSKNVLIKFINTGFKLKTSANHVKDGFVRDFSIPEVCNVGYLGSQKRVDRKIYLQWKAMIHRCYRENHHRENNTYKDCTVCKEWLCYFNFEKWHLENYTEGWDLDKDLIKKGNKIYSPTTCCFLPNYINSAIVCSRIKNNGLPVGVNGNKNGTYQARVCKFGKDTHIGCYESINDCHKAYCFEKEAHVRTLAKIHKHLLPIRTYDALLNFKVD